MRWMAACFMMTLVGCTTLQPISQSRAQLQEQIASGNLLTRDDRIQVTLESGESFDLVVVRIGDGMLQGRDRSVEIAEVVSIQRREVDSMKTAGLAVGVTGATLLLTTIVLSSLVFFP